MMPSLATATPSRAAARLPVFIPICRPSQSFQPSTRSGRVGAGESCPIIAPRSVTVYAGGASNVFAGVAARTRTATPATPVLRLAAADAAHDPAAAAALFAVDPAVHVAAAAAVLANVFACARRTGRRFVAGVKRSFW